MPSTLTSPFFRSKNQAASTGPSHSLPTPKSTSTSKRNGSILNFFKKSDKPPRSTQSRITEFGVRSRKDFSAGQTRSLLDDGTAGLFFEDVTPHISAPDTQTDGDYSPRKQTDLPDTLWPTTPSPSERIYEDDDRYNEYPGAVKRRKTGSEIVVVGEFAENSPTSVTDGGSSARRPSEQTPQTIATELPSYHSKRSHGPFLDESDSDSDGEPTLRTQMKTSKQEAAPADCHAPTDSENHLLSLGPPQEDKSHVSTCLPVNLEREVDGNMLEEDSLADKESCLASELEDEVPVCPLCQITLADLTDAEASLHVNDCLDGKSTPVVSKVEHLQKSRQPTIVPAGTNRKTISKPGQKNPFTSDITAQASTSAFMKMMSAKEEDSAWAAAAASEVASRGKQAYERTCPFYKILPGFFITVDAFRYGSVEGCNAYFLSHYHSDHYGGLTSSWSHGPIYCSRITANLVKQQLKVNPDMVIELEFEKRTEIPRTDGVYVTMISANHCPGSSLFLFEKRIRGGKDARLHRILHCGDFRASPAQVNHPLLRPDATDTSTGKSIEQKIDVCYLDTTYLNPKYAFPFQLDVISACAQMCAALDRDDPDPFQFIKSAPNAPTSIAAFQRKGSGSGRDPNEDSHGRGKLLVVIGTYSIGKERICVGVAKALNSKIYASPYKKQICECLEDKEFSSLLTTNPLEAQVHMHSLMDMRSGTLIEYLNPLKSRFSRIVGFRPTGWSYRPRGGKRTDNPTVSSVLHSDAWKSSYSVSDLVPQRGSTKDAACFSVPYSEHSSFRELTMFCCALRISRIIPTVNVGNPKSREKMKYWIDKWEIERRKNGLFQVKDDATRW